MKWLIFLFMAAMPAVFTAKELPAFAYGDFECLVKNAYYEARGEGVKGMEAVTAVAMNRMKRDNETACAVIMKPKQWSWTLTHRLEHYVTDQRGLAVATRAVHSRFVAGDAVFRRHGLGHVSGKIVQTDRSESSLLSATHYHATYVKPYWAKHMKKLGRVGNHIFYKE